jgi:hypothetical protein
LGGSRRNSSLTPARVVRGLTSKIVIIQPKCTLSQKIIASQALNAFKDKYCNKDNHRSRRVNRLQIFKVLPSKETEEVCEGTLQDQLTPKAVLFIVDHESRKIFFYKGKKARLSLQILGTLLAQELRKQLKLFYQVFDVPGWEKLPEEVSALLDLTPEKGKAEEIRVPPTEEVEENAAPELSEEEVTPPRRFWGSWQPPGGNLAPVHHSIVTKDVIHKLQKVPPPPGYLRNLLQVGGELFSENIYLESFVQNRKNVVELEKIGGLPDGFTFIENLPFRLFSVRGQVEAIDYLIPWEQLPNREVRIEVPVLYKDRLLHQRDPVLLLKAFQLPPEDQIEVESAEAHGGFNDNEETTSAPDSGEGSEEPAPERKGKSRPFTI